MKFERIVVYLAAVYFLQVTATASAQILIDDFNDGNADGWTPVFTNEGEPWGPGIFDASSGAYNLKTTGEVAVGALGAMIAVWDASIDPFYSEGYWRATVRMEKGGSNVGFVLRDSDPFLDDSSQYFLSTNIFGDLLLWKDDDVVSSISLNYGPGEDWIIEAGTVGDLISAKMWRAGSPVPDQPQVSFRDATYSTGQFGLVSFVGSNWAQPAQLDTVFDDIYFTPVPEPSGLTMLSLLLVTAVFGRRRLV